ncbi:MAG TPA: serine/threonine-protein kinase, partial [Candidatus Elarobacter sp.]|nr:serine/threonine-protein kinase [Candidatus Elarobacter sp.]
QADKSLPLQRRSDRDVSHSPTLRTDAPSSRHADIGATLSVALGPAYRVEREIGAGGMARVVAATDTATGQRVAITILAPALASCCDADRFRREMALAASLAHPNIVPLLRECDVCGGDRLFYFVMPYIESESLRERLDREGTLSEPDAVRVLSDVASASTHALQHGVVHRDIKPANVPLSNGRALVAAHLTGAPPPLPARTTLPSAVVDLVMLRLEKRPEDRPQSAAAVREVLDQFRAWALMAQNATERN